MATGIAIYNDSGTVQIDENYRNVCLVSKIPVSLSGGGIQYHDVTVAGARVLMCMESANYSPFLFNTAFDGTYWTYRWGFNYLGGGFPSSDTAYAWVFDYLTSPPSDTFGLKVWNASGEMVFHSSSKPLKIVSVQSHPTGFTGTSGRKYLPLIMLNSYFVVTSIPSNFSLTYGLRTVGSSIVPNSFVIGTGALTVVATDGLFAAVDVTYY